MDYYIKIMKNCDTLLVAFLLRGKCLSDIESYA